MSVDAKQVELAGSYLPERLGVRHLGEAQSRERKTLTIYLKDPSQARHEPGRAAALADLLIPTTQSELAAQRGAAYGEPAELFAKFAETHGFAIRTDLPRGCLYLDGDGQALAAAFGTKLHLYEHRHTPYTAHSSPLLVPSELAPWTRAIVGLNDRPLRRRLRAFAGMGAGAGLWPSDIARLYDVPQDAEANGQCIGIVALGGGYRTADLVAAAQGANRPSPVVVDRSVSGAVNNFQGGDDSDQEIALDIQVATGIAVGARVVVYFTPNTISNLAEAIHTAVFDDVNRPQVISVSWGSAEEFWTNTAQEAVQAALEDAVRLNVTVVVASGDGGATAGVDDGQAHVSFPASSPYVLACGGTQITLGPEPAEGITGETVWNDGTSGSGGGISDQFPVPDYQKSVGLPPSVNGGGARRGVPDVAAFAASNPGYRIILNDQPMVKDGTSAATPLWAALIALANARRGAPVGLVNPLLYANPGLCRSVVTGNNRVDGVGYDAGPGWNACTGLGVPQGADIIAALSPIA
jgi:kumamolisin